MADNAASWTGKYLKEVLDRHEERRKTRVAALPEVQKAEVKKTRARKSA